MLYKPKPKKRGKTNQAMCGFGRILPSCAQPRRPFVPKKKVQALAQFVVFGCPAGTQEPLPWHHWSCQDVIRTTNSK